MAQLTFFQYYRLLHHHRKLAERRDPMFSQNRWAKFFSVLMGTFFLCYFVFLTILLSLIANDVRTVTALEFFMGMSPLILMVDFFFRVCVLQTPAQLVKPYVLLPMPKFMCIDCMLLESLLSSFNLLWLVVALPFCIMSVVFAYGFWAAVSMVVLFLMMVLVNSQWYAVVRTLTLRNVFWWLLPIAVFGAMLLPWFVNGFDAFFQFYGTLGQGLEHGNLLPHVLIAALLAGVVAVNRRIQMRAVMEEVRKDAPKKLKHVSRLSMLNRFGQLGEYLKLEVKSIIRNKNPRKSALSALSALVVFSVIICFTSVYDTNGMTNFFCIYNFVVLGDVLLVKIMAFEGNYIDVLMVHRENIYKLLLAKYYFFVCLLALPFVMMLPLVIMGKWSFLMVMAYGLFTAGFQYFMLMQLAVYNKQRLPLNETHTTKGGIEINYVAFLVEMGSFLIPITFVSLMEDFFDEQTAWVIMLLVGCAFIATHRLWIRNIYRRMMARKYDHLEAFHA